MSSSAPGSFISAFGSLQAGQSTADSLQAQAALQRQQAQEALNAGQYDAMKSQMMSSMSIGKSIAAYGASGVTANSGSVLAVLAASASNAELDRLNILHGADIKAANYRNQAAMDEAGASSAIAGSRWAAFGNIMSGLSNAASSTYSGANAKADAQMPSVNDSGGGLAGSEFSDAGAGVGGMDSAGFGEGAGMDSAAALA